MRDAPPDPERDQADGEFPDARAVHDAIAAAPEEYPDGWVEQVRFRERYDLPPFRPPRFVDDTPIHEVIARLETELDVHITFVRYGEDWTVEVEGTRAFAVTRHRDDAANTVVEMDSETFGHLVRRVTRE